MKKTILSLSVFVLLLLLLSFSIKVKDREGRVYATVKIGSQTWMAENLRVSVFRNGDTIPMVYFSVDWEKAARNGTPAWTYGPGDLYGNKYGKLYNWYAVNDPRGLAPKGWHIPSQEEWNILTDTLGGRESAGPKLKSKTGWKCMSGTNTSGFNANLCYEADTSGTSGTPTRAAYWTSSEKHGYGSYQLIFDCTNDVGLYLVNKKAGIPVRCIED